MPKSFRQRRQEIIAAQNAAARAEQATTKEIGYQVQRITKNCVVGPDRERNRVRRHDRRAILSCTIKPITREEWLAICDAHDNRCAACGSDGPLTMDHIIPVSKGGPNNRENVQPLCKSCNSSKGARHSTDYRKAV